jgi:hypothetical protein
MKGVALTWLSGRSTASVREALRQHAPPADWVDDLRCRLDKIDMADI